MERPSTRSDPAWLKSQGNAGEARIVYAANSVGGTGVDAAEVAAKEASMDSSIRARFSGLLGSVTRKHAEQIEAARVAEEEKVEREADLEALASQAQREREEMHADSGDRKTSSPSRASRGERKPFLQASWMRIRGGATPTPTVTSKTSATGEGGGGEGGRGGGTDTGTIIVSDGSDGGNDNRVAARVTERAGAGGGEHVSDLLSVDPTDTARWAALQGVRSGVLGAAEWAAAPTQADLLARTCTSVPVVRALKAGGGSGGGLNQRDLKYVARVWRLLDEARREVPALRRVAEPHVMPRASTSDPSEGSGGGAVNEKGMSAVDRLKAAIARGKRRASDEEGEDADTEPDVNAGDAGEVVEEVILDELPDEEEDADTAEGDTGGVGAGGGAVSVAERRKRKRRSRSRDGDDGGGGDGGDGGGISQEKIEELLASGLTTDELIDMGIIKDNHRGVDDNDAAAAAAAAAAAEVTAAGSDATDETAYRGDAVEVMATGGDATEETAYRGDAVEVTAAEGDAMAETAYRGDAVEVTAAEGDATVETVYRGDAVEVTAAGGEATVETAEGVAGEDGEIESLCLKPPRVLAYKPQPLYPKP